MNFVRSLLLLSFLLGSSPLPTSAQDQWLPPQVAEALASQVADKMQAIDSTADRERLMTGGRRLITLIRRRLDSWGEKEVLARAPQFPKLAMPASTQPHLDAINRYQVCNLLLDVQQAAQNDIGMRRTGVIGSAAITTAAVYLRKPFLEAGGKLPDVEKFLTGSAMQSVFEAIQNDRSLADHVAEQCTPVVTSLLQPPDE